jgi:hypothetical protein
MTTSSKDKSKKLPDRWLVVAWQTRELKRDFSTRNEGRAAAGDDNVKQLKYSRERRRER